MKSILNNQLFSIDEMYQGLNSVIIIFICAVGDHILKTWLQKTRQGCKCFVGKRHILSKITETFKWCYLYFQKQVAYIYKTFVKKPWRFQLSSLLEIGKIYLVKDNQPVTELIASSQYKDSHYEENSIMGNLYMKKTPFIFKRGAGSISLYWASSPNEFL